MLGGIPNTEIRPLVIFGAGASYDLIDNPEFHRNQYRPPVTNDIFNELKFNEIQNRHPFIGGLIGMIRHRLNNSMGLEQALEELSRDPVYQLRFRSQLPFLEKYLQDLFVAAVASNNYSSNNYASFFANMAQMVTIPYFVVNFNYDSFAQTGIEASLGLSFTGIQDFIEGSIRLVQPHGSINWRIESGEPVTAVTSSSDILALTLPLINGKKFVCPNSHINALKAYIGLVNVIIIIGWKGSENHFKEAILDHITQPPKRIIVVGGSGADKELALKNSGLNRFRNVSRLYIDGFSNLFRYYPDFRSDIMTEHLI